MRRKWLKLAYFLELILGAFLMFLCSATDQPMLMLLSLTGTIIGALVFTILLRCPGCGAPQKLALFYNHCPYCGEPLDD